MVASVGYMGPGPAWPMAAFYKRVMLSLVQNSPVACQI
jgi:hypothetical protein